ncbi:Mss4-like protein [Boeremia exigua]|uniref:Mss4-like protein n=1 Tax=Boeremia exigua TaxID=749465 RepID=UPI001E8E5AFA|nr:Mss4-like protein [Boeremia exigua]KAH6638006.1 Mss4-like protein [Boeremia exigua]
MSDAKAPTETYKASCHCGAFAYTVKTASLAHETTEVVRCNCSICLRNGIYNIYVPDDDITFTTGQFADLKSYTFATHSVAHRFCPTCGSSCMARSIRPGFFDGVSIVNVRMFEGVEVEKLRFKEMDGKSYTKEKAEARVAEIEAEKEKAAAESGV